MMQSPCNEREAQVLRDAYETHGIASHYMDQLGPSGAKDVLMHLRLPNVLLAASLEKAELPAAASDACGAAAPPSARAVAKATSSEIPAPQASSKGHFEVHDKQSYVKKERRRVAGLSSEAEAEVERRWQAKKRRLLDGVSTMQMDAFTALEDECLRNGWTLYIIDGDTRYYKEPTREAMPDENQHAPKHESSAAAADAVAIARSSNTALPNEAKTPVVGWKADDDQTRIETAVDAVLETPVDEAVAGAVE